MAARAYVLIEADPGQIDSVRDVLRSLPQIRSVDALAGPYDLIAMVESSDERTVGRVVMETFHAIDGIQRTTTCLVIHS
ncbi:MAG: Lrp/AsnC ligand binding domain-containing protein [Kouleothrix sp.]|nr:Lrp/AsnC ligand binding domain-containing protein [Kouleothrix sp.]